MARTSSEAETAAGGERMAVRTELFCHFCGHGVGEVLVPTSRRPTNAELKLAYQAQHPQTGPLWFGEEPRCPRCKGQLFLDQVETTRLRRTA